MGQDDDRSLSITASTPPSLSSLFCESTIRGLSDWEDLLHIGENNIERLIIALRSDEKLLRERIREVSSEQSLFSGRCGEDIKTAAAQFEDPTNITLGLQLDSYTGDPEPIDADSINRKRDSTTFNRCGWCKYAGGGMGRYGFMITPACNLLRHTTRAEEAGPANTPCRLQSMSTDDFAKIAEGMAQQIEDLKRKLEGVRNGIRKLQEIKKGQITKPYLMTLRPSEYFNLGDRVMMYIGGQKLDDRLDLGGQRIGDRLLKGDWAPGKVIMGYRHHDGCVSTCADFPIWRRRDYLNGAGNGYGTGRPECLLAGDFYYLHKNYVHGDYRFVELWLDNADNPHRMDYSHLGFEEALKAGGIATPDEAASSVIDVCAIHTTKDAVNALCLLSEPKNLKELDEWYRFMAGQVHPDRFDKATDEVKAYLNRQLATYNEARELLTKELNLK